MADCRGGGGDGIWDGGVRDFWQKHKSHTFYFSSPAIGSALSSQKESHATMQLLYTALGLMPKCKM